MPKLLEGTRLRRRSVLLGSGLAVAGFAGCLDDEPAEEIDNDGDTGGDDDDDGDDDGDGDGEGSLTEPEAPEPDFVVGESDDADYETIQEAYAALESGDVIGLEPGTHTLQPEVDNAEVGDGEDLIKTYTYVGDPDEETIIEFVKPDADSFVVRGPQRFRPEDGPPGFWNLTLELPDDVSFDRIDEYEDDYSETQSDVNYCIINGTFDGPVDAYETTFNDSLSHELSPTNCQFRADVSGSRITARRCQFDGALRSEGGYVLDSTIEGTTNLNSMTMIRCELNAGLNVTGNGRVESCVIESFPDSSQAISISSSYDVAITESEIRGSVRSNQDGSYIERFELNVFDVPSSTRYIIDGAPATDIYLNAFLGGDVRITTDSGDLSTFPADDLTLYDPERELGNYYSEWDGDVDREDEDDELHILETRTIPGEDGEMDRHPLASPDLEAYAEAAADDDD
ncbi:hypothetical protein [Natrarchaeobaculum sulfurireducens]|uniref:Uncharacterized protein n=1 Tax=Natrarchaeobaculum sulfurireducens TaxID=2044521 RepID=A0A346PE63_9EURY|nr:hypothetical protein [Natrarchaeobaculum sulfurireducens]AXR77808.1 hypothetical protein AArc1_1474 [Natrarchaeobaculum sulfurireducens]